MKNKRFIIFLLILLSPLFPLLLPESASAFSVFGVGSRATITQSIENYQNWPYEIRRQCVIEQSRVVTDCSKCGYDNWVVFQTVKGRGSVDGKDCTMLYQGVVVGNYTCEPPELVIEDGKLVDTNHYINSRFFRKKDKDAEFICDFLCYGWNCVEGQERPCLKKLEQKGYDKKNIFCMRWMFIDKDHDGLDDVTGKTSGELYWEQKDMLDKVFKEHIKRTGVEDCKLDWCWTEWVVKESTAETWEEEDWAPVPEEIVYELCFHVPCIEFEAWPKTTLREGDLEEAKRLLEKYEQYDLLRDIDQARVTPQFKSTGAASGHVADLTVTSNTNELLTFDLKNTGLEGVLLVNPIEEEQNLVVATVPGISVSPTSYKAADNVTLNPNESITFPVMGYCANFDEKNPSEGIELTLGGLIGVEPTEEFGLDGLLGDTPQTAVIANFEGTEFPQSFTPENVITIKQIALWASQAENKDRTPEDYEIRGYTIEEDYVPIIRDVLEQSGVNPDEIVALTGKKKEPEKPATFISSDLTISPAEIDIGESVTIGVLVTNTGDLTGSYEVNLKIDNVPVATEDVTLSGGESQTVTFTTAKDFSGTYTVSVNSLSGTFTVKTAQVPAKPINWWLIGGSIASCAIIGLLAYFFVWRKRAA